MKLPSMAPQATPSPAMVCNNGSHGIARAFRREASPQPPTSRAPGLDQGTAPPDAEPLAEPLHERPERLRDKRHVAPPVERVGSEKAEGKKRPRGPPCGEDKRGQRAVVMILDAIFAPDFPGFSHGVRTGHRQPQARHERRAQGRRLHRPWRGEAEVRGFVDPLDGSPLRAWMQQRGQDGGIVRLIGPGLHAGVREAGALSSPAKGTPPGGVVSPL
jgi:hypothetical protein